MTETRPQPGIDPRFDPRYQRGYVPDPSAPPLEAPPASAPAAPVGSPSPGPSAAPDSDPVPAFAPDFAPRRDPVARDDGGHRVSDPADDPDADTLASFDEVDDEPSPGDPWFLAAWGVAVVAVAVGIAFWWAGIMAENPFSGPSESDRWLQYVGWIVAPALVQAGLIGIVGMLVWTGVRWARRRAESP